MKLALDHLVIAAPDLDAGTAHVADLLGIAPCGGGEHAAMGTHNRVLGMFGGIYLEVIAIDPAAAAPARPRWFGLDTEAVRQRLENGPFLLHWAARVERPADLTLWQSQYPARIAPVIPMTRGDLRWRITVPEDGALPGWQGEAHAAGDGLFPSLIQWDVAAYPGTSLPRQDLALRKLSGRHPRAELLRQGLAWLGADHLIAIEQSDGQPELSAEIETPQGIRTLR
ncbi:VOC family protein [Cupriavidus sp. AcVe19-6a]|uniref:VOC family protein n=1 Tax=Cupriavidus sp. AcVe19-6a TaxID=2821358 RepID=UPI001AEA6AB8|nr:VOC family protein [Cupriavidus sp. AcVe19-6a]MBP0639363.1 VOC family protein [Cupriavidus sp. AcVe19-6a]